MVRAFTSILAVKIGMGEKKAWLAPEWSSRPLQSSACVPVSRNSSDNMATS